ncbi:MAG: NAD-dependent epimerase/dehydratase family protein, partial [bacterium]|nr:NAD-dependent epimerase/dehydratase family protein [bacterium]
MLKSKTCLVTGCAGFIGSHLTERLLAEGCSVVGIDVLRDYYDPAIKKQNMSNFINNKNFVFHQEDLNKINLNEIVKRVGYIFHEAAQAGVRASWGKEFNIYVDDNILATHRLLEMLKEHKNVKMIFASSSSVYGDSAQNESVENSMLDPVSPYGVTKLAAEKLAHVYYKNYLVPVVSLRYFTVFGPRQRPDMGLYKFIKAALQNEEIVIYGDGNQRRDFTYVTDIIEANILAMKNHISGECFNIGSGSNQTINEELDKIEKITGNKLKRIYSTKAMGDVI